MIAIFDTNAHVVIDIFLLVLLFIIPAVLVGVQMARRRRYRAHALINSVCFFTFLAAVVAFEFVVHFGPPGPPLPPWPLTIHLCFAVPCLVIWIVQMASGKNAKNTPKKHRKRGQLLLALLGATVGTGVWLYMITFT